MRVAGIDPDTKSIAVVIIEDGKTNIVHLKAKGRKAEDRFRFLVSAFADLIFGGILDKVDFTFVEQPVMVRNPKAVRDQAFVVGAIRAILGDKHSLVDNTVWKKGVIGNGMATKEEIKEFIVGAFPDLGDSHDQDVYDAAGIALFGLRGLA